MGCRTYHFHKLCHLAIDRELFAGLEDLLVLWGMWPLCERVDIILLLIPLVRHVATTDTRKEGVLMREKSVIGLREERNHLKRVTRVQ